LTCVQDQSDLGNFLLLEFFGKKPARVTGSQTPVEGAQRIAGVIFADSKKVRPAPAQIIFNLPW